MTKERIDLTGFLMILVLTILWGINYFAIKVSNESLSPVFTCLLRSIIASALGMVYCVAVGQPLFHRDIRLFHGLMVGLLFGAEFICLYLGMLYTNAARAAVFLYLSPFVVAIGAHLFLGEKLNSIKSVSLVLAFFGLYLVFTGKPAMHTRSMLLGDMLEIIAAIFWGATTLYIKRYLAHSVHPINTFVYQLIFSIPIILIAALFLEPTWIRGTVSQGAIFSFVYQSVIIAFASYLLWFKLIHVYPVASLSVFTFLAPVFGVASGVVFLNEDLTKGLVAGLICVCAGIYGTNYRKRKKPVAVARS
jgi:drug/metabolite transporter (DMT)-like permease